MDKKPTVLVIGGGLGGVNVARGLQNAAVDIFLVDRRNHHLFQPLLYQVATAELEPAAVAAPIRQILHKQKNVTIALAEVKGIDLERKVVIGKRGEFGYDYLVIATGVQPAYFGRDEFKSFAPGLKSIDDAHEIRRRILLAFEEAEWEADEAARRARLTFVIVGGGPTGVELAGAIMDAAKRTLPKDFRRIDTTTTRVILLDGGDQLVKAMPDVVSQRIHKDLTEMGVEIRLHTRVSHVDVEGVMVGEERIFAGNVFWAAGVQGVPLAKTLDVEMDRAGRIIVGPDLSIPDYPEVFVIGDAAAATDAKTGNSVPGVAQGAIQSGKFVAEIIKQDLQGTSVAERPSFSYFDKGSMAIIGRGKGVTAVGKIYFGGFVGFLAWSVLHMAFLVGFGRKLTVTLVWIWNYIRNERAARIITGDPETRIKQVVGLTPIDHDPEE
ncbi:MAG: NAD(P)/FAD-dependent oxidoreductase [Chloroflexi bacterium]|nr:NAD(P)/FAD-dependent oxidoreductase [Chloroflexota bacterium]